MSDAISDFYRTNRVDMNFRFNYLVNDLTERPFGIPSIISLSDAEMVGAALFMEDAHKRMEAYVKEHNLNPKGEAVVTSPSSGNVRIPA